jgi:hypothetical protein
MNVDVAYDQPVGKNGNCSVKWLVFIQMMKYTDTVDLNIIIVFLETSSDMIFSTKSCL